MLIFESSLGDVPGESYAPRRKVWPIYGGLRLYRLKPLMCPKVMGCFIKKTTKKKNKKKKKPSGFR